MTFSGFFGSMVAVPFTLGEILAVLLAMVFTDWRHLQIAAAVFCLMVGIVWFFISESPRWLIATGKNKKARGIIEAAAKKNKVEVITELMGTESIITDSIEEDIDNRSESTINTMFLRLRENDYGFKDLFNKTCCRITIALFLIWPAFGLLYFGLTLASGKINVTSNMHVSFILMCLIEIPADFFFPIIMDLVGRKPLIAICLFIPGVFCIIN